MRMRLRLRNHDLRELAPIYRVSANVDRQKADGMRNNRPVEGLIGECNSRADDAENLNGLRGLRRVPDSAGGTLRCGSPSLMVVGGSDATDGSAFLPKRARRKRA